MQVTRRQFLKVSGAGALGGIALTRLGINIKPVKSYVEATGKANRIKNSSQTTSICCYCSCGCGLICSTDGNGAIFNIEGDPDHPINEGTLCPKGANMMQTSAANEHRLTKVKYRSAYNDRWVDISWDDAITKIAEKIKAVRDADFIKTNNKGKTVNRVETIAMHGSSNINNEECFMMSSTARALGMVYIDHQARV